MGWQDYATVTVEIASVSGMPSGGEHAGYWQPDAHGSLWQPPAPDVAAAGYAEWSPDVVRDPHSDWETLPWFVVKCDQSQIDTSTGFAPYEWNASPGSMTCVLWDASIQYSPIGPTGLLDDIGIDTPIRIKATGPGIPWLTSGSPFTILWAGMIRQIVHRVSPNGQHVTTISASEAVEVYGRTNPVALTTSRPVEQVTPRLNAIHDRSDRPLALPYPTTYYIPQKGLQHPVDDLHDNVWQELCAAMNVHGAVTAQLTYPRNVTTNTNGQPLKGSPMATAIDPIWALRTQQTYPIHSWVQVRPYCSDTLVGKTVKAISAIAPTELSITHNLDGVANDLDLAIANLDGSAQNFKDQASIDHWGRHTYTRHDLKLNPASGPPNLTILGADMLTRTKDAVYAIDNMTFPVTCPRDLLCLVGGGVYNVQSGSDWFRNNTEVCAPGEVWFLVWDNPAVTAYLMLTSVAHSISRNEWTVTLSAELQSVNNVPGTLPVPVPKLALLESV